MVSFLWARVWQWHNPDSSRASNIIIHFMQRQLRRLSVLFLSVCSLSGEYLWFKQNSHFKSGFCSLSFAALGPSPLRCHCYWQLSEATIQIALSTQRQSNVKGQPEWWRFSWCRLFRRWAQTVPVPVLESISSLVRLPSLSTCDKWKAFHTTSSFGRISP